MATDPKPISRGRAIAYAIFGPLGLIAFVFLPTGRIDWRPGWIYVAFLIGVFGLSLLIIGLINPRIFRARSGFQKGTKRWDLAILILMLPAIMAEIPVAAYDAGRMHGSSPPEWVTPTGYALLLFGVVMTAWAQAVNPFFEPGVRIQSEREQRPITTGPYRFVRHPGYLGALALFAGLSLALGSWWGLVPGGIASVLLVIRTAFEDGLLRRELPGYADYARRTRYRLAPGIW